MIDTEFVLGGEILQSAKSLANSLLAVDVSVDDFVRDLPHDCGGGWPDVDPDDAFVAYSQVTEGEFKGIVAMSRGSNQKIRMQGVAIGLVLSAVIKYGIGVLPEQHQHIAGFNELVEQAEAAMTEHAQKPAGCRRHIRRSEQMAERALPVTRDPPVASQKTRADGRARTSRPAVGGSSRSSRDAHPSVETRTDLSHLDERLKFRSDISLVQNTINDMVKRLQELESH